MRPETLNHYRIVNTLGSGGMGEVYLAEDTKLNRKVAVKVLLEHAAADPERRERFAREARAVAAITHPNIVTIHSVEEDAGRLFLTMEYVDGKPLGDAIPRGGMALDKLLAIAIPLADAVASAHQQGVVHRDLKPANVMLSADGRVKVLDFGLAKLRDDRVPGGETMTAQITGEGRVLGTAAYMAPEQAEAKPVDARSDLFSLGVMLYEMATGERPFKGDSTASLISSILRDTPQSVTALRRDVPRELARIIKRCLQKDPEQRYQTAKDLRNDLQLLKAEIDSGEISATDIAPATGTGNASRRKPLAIAAGVLLVAVAALAGYVAVSKATSVPPPFAEFTTRKLTNQGNLSEPALSPDGTYVTYAAREEHGESVRVKQLSTGTDSVILGARQGRYVGFVFSPDGQYIYYVFVASESSPFGMPQGTLYRVTFLGGPSTKLIENITGMVGLSSDGKRVAFTRVDPSSGETRLITADVDGSHEKLIATKKRPEAFTMRAPAWSPDGRTIAASVWKRWDTIVLYPSEGGPEQVIAGSTSWGAIHTITFAPDGRGVYVCAAERTTGWFFQIWHASVPAGTVRQVTKDSNNYLGLSVSRDGSSIVTLQSDWLSSLSVAPASEPQNTTPLGVGHGDGFGGVTWTPDGRIVYGTREWDIGTMDADGRNQRILTTEEHNNRHPAVSRDGRYIYFVSWRGDGALGSQYRMNMDGGEVKALGPTGSFTEFPHVTPDGKWLLLYADSEGKPGIWKMSTEGGKAELFTKEVTSPCAISPDGTRVAGFHSDSATRRASLDVLSLGKAEIVKAFEMPEGVAPGIGIHWTPDSSGVVYVGMRGEIGNLWMQPLSGGPPKQLTDFKSDLIWDFDWSRDNRIVMARGRRNEDILLISERRDGK